MVFPAIFCHTVSGMANNSASVYCLASDAARLGPIPGNVQSVRACPVMCVGVMRLPRTTRCSRLWLHLYREMILAAVSFLLFLTIYNPANCQDSSMLSSPIVVHLPFKSPAHFPTLPLNVVWCPVTISTGTVYAPIIFSNCSAALPDDSDPIKSEAVFLSTPTAPSGHSHMKSPC